MKSTSWKQENKKYICFQVMKIDLTNSGNLLPIYFQTLYTSHEQLFYFILRFRCIDRKIYALKETSNLMLFPF